MSYVICPPNLFVFPNILSILPNQHLVSHLLSSQKTLFHIPEFPKTFLPMVTTTLLTNI